MRSDGDARQELPEYSGERSTAAASTNQRPRLNHLHLNHQTANFFCCDSNISYAPDESPNQALPLLVAIFPKHLKHGKKLIA